MLRVFFQGVLTTALFTSLASAASFDLAGLIAGTVNSGVVVVGDKRFSDFSFTRQTATCELLGGGATTGCTYTPSSPLIPGALTINTLDNDPFGISLGGAISASADAGRIAFYDVVFGYTVEVLDPSKSISAIQQMVTGGGSGNGGSIVVTESAFGVNPVGSTANSTVSFGDITDPPGEVTQGDMLVFAPTPVKKADIRKDIQITAKGTTTAGSIVSISLIQQRFEQVPEPSGLAALLMAGLGTLIWKKRSQAAA